MGYVQLVLNFMTQVSQSYNGANGFLIELAVSHLATNTCR